MTLWRCHGGGIVHLYTFWHCLLRNTRNFPLQLDGVPRVTADRAE